MTWGTARCTDTCCVPEEAGEEYLVLRRGYVKQTRKPHPCVNCGGEITPGESAYTVTVKDFGRVFTDYRHPVTDCAVAP